MNNLLFCIECNKFFGHILGEKAEEISFMCKDCIQSEPDPIEDDIKEDNKQRYADMKFQEKGFI